MSGSCRYDASLDGLADESHVAYDVKQLVACTLVVPDERAVLDVSKFLGVYARHAECVAQHIHLLLLKLSLVYDDGIVEVAAFDEVGL